MATKETKKKEVVEQEEKKTAKKKAISKKETVTKSESKKEKKSKKKDQPKKEGFIKSTFKEMKLVHFPNKKEMIKYSIATILFIVFFGVLFYAVELIVAWLKMVV